MPVSVVAADAFLTADVALCNVCMVASLPSLPATLWPLKQAWEKDHHMTSVSTDFVKWKQGEED